MQNRYSKVRDIPAMKHMISLGKGQCFHEASEVARTLPLALSWLTQALSSPMGYNVSYTLLSRDILRINRLVKTSIKATAVHLLISIHNSTVMLGPVMNGSLAHMHYQAVYKMNCQLLSFHYTASSHFSGMCSIARDNSHILHR